MCLPKLGFYRAKTLSGGKRPTRRLFTFSSHLWPRHRKQKKGDPPTAGRIAPPLLELPTPAHFTFLTSASGTSYSPNVSTTTDPSVAMSIFATSEAVPTPFPFLSTRN